MKWGWKSRSLQLARNWRLFALSTAVVLARVRPFAEAADVFVSAGARQGAPCTVEADADGLAGSRFPFCPFGKVGLAPFAPLAPLAGGSTGRSKSGPRSVLQGSQPFSPFSSGRLRVLKLPLLPFALGLGLRLWGRRCAVLNGELRSLSRRLGCRAPGAKSWGCDCPTRVDRDVRVDAHRPGWGIPAPGPQNGFSKSRWCIGSCFRKQGASALEMWENCGCVSVVCV